MPPTLLVTGFGPFPGVPVNPTAALVRSLDGRALGGCAVRAAVLDVSFRRAADQLANAVAACPPAALLHFGVAAGSARIRLERQAVNRIAADRRDADGQDPAAPWVDPRFAADAALTTAVALPPLIAQLTDRGLDAEISDDAGRYVCNALYFASLALQRGAPAPRPCLFVHVPPVDAARWTAAQLTTAAEVLLRALAADLTPLV